MDYSKVDVRNVVNELNILRRRIRKYEKIILSHNKTIKSLRYSCMNLTTGIEYYKKVSEANKNLLARELRSNYDPKDLGGKK